MAPSLYVHSFQSSFDEVSIVWFYERTKPMVRRIILSNEKVSSAVIASAVFHGISPAVTTAVKKLRVEIEKMFSGQIPEFDMSMFDFSVCSAFQREVIREQRKIPRGKVSSYGQLASRLRKPAGARAVGNALAGNPYPLVVPCHRTVMSDGLPGGFQGGSEKKRAFLEMEGVTFGLLGRVKPENYYIQEEL